MCRAARLDLPPRALDGLRRRIAGVGRHGLLDALGDPRGCFGGHDAVDGGWDGGGEGDVVAALTSWWEARSGVPWFWHGACSVHLGEHGLSRHQVGLPRFPLHDAYPVRKPCPLAPLLAPALPSPSPIAAHRRPPALDPFASRLRSRSSDTPGQRCVYSKTLKAPRPPCRCRRRRRRSL